MKRIKLVKRIDLPETNSSSSHSVSISMKNNNLVKPGDSDYNLDIRDGVLYIPGNKSFGWEFFKYNTPLEKLQYVCGIYCGQVDDRKRLYRLKKMLIEILGVKDVVFEWFEDYKKELRKGLDPEEIYYSCPEIDHNSSDIFEEIIENKETIKNFILSRDSWLFGGNDNSDNPPGFFGNTYIDLESEEPEAIVSIDLGGKFGRIDFEIPIFPITDGQRDVVYNIINGLPGDIVNLSDFCWIPGENKFDLVTDKYVLQSKIKIFSINLNMPYTYSPELSLIFSGDKFREVYNNEHKKIEKELGKFIKTREDRERYYILKNKLNQDVLSKCIKGVDYILLPIHITLLKYGINV